MASHYDDDDLVDEMESRIELLVSDMLSESFGEETLREASQLGSVAMEDETAVRSEVNENGHSEGGTDEDSNKQEPKVKRVDKLEVKERQLQTARQLWAIFDAMGPAKAPIKCHRPFVGRQQELYEELLVSTTNYHKAELKEAALRETFDKHMAALEALFILKGLSKFKRGSNEVGLLPDELTMMHSWFLEFKAFMTMRKKKANILNLVKVFELDDLCMAADYISSEGTEALSFSTRRRRNAYDVSITLNVDCLEVNIKRQEQDPQIQLPTGDLVRLAKKAAKKRLSVQELVRYLFWPYIDKAQQVIFDVAENSSE